MTNNGTTSGRRMPMVRKSRCLIVACFGLLALTATVKVAIVPNPDHPHTFTMHAGASPGFLRRLGCLVHDDD